MQESFTSLEGLLSTVLDRLPDSLTDPSSVEGLRAVLRMLPDTMRLGPVGLELRLAGSPTIDVFASASPGHVNFEDFIRCLREPLDQRGWHDQGRANDLAQALERWAGGEGTCTSVARYLLVEADAPASEHDPVAVPAIFLSPRGFREVRIPGQPLNAFHQRPDLTTMAVAELHGVWPDPETLVHLERVLKALDGEGELFAVGSMINRDTGSSMRIALKRVPAGNVARVLAAAGLASQGEILQEIAMESSAERQAIAFDIGEGAEDRAGLELSPERNWREASFEGWPRIIEELSERGVLDLERGMVLEHLVDGRGEPLWGLAHIKVGANANGLIPVAKAYVGIHHEHAGAATRASSVAGSRPPQQGIHAGLQAIDKGVGRRGQWPGAFGISADDTEAEEDLTPTLTALGILALQGLHQPHADEIIERSRAHVRATVLPGGLWRYFANIPADVDDSAICALSLGADEATTSTRDSLLAVRMPDGLFPTWFEPGWKPAVDAVANAHAVAWIGECEETRIAIDWLDQIVRSGTEIESCVYYPDPLDLHVAISRAVARGVSRLAACLEVAATRALGRLNEPHLSGHRIAQAIIVVTASNQAADVPRHAVSRLLSLQQQDGSWAAETLYAARATDSHGVIRYRSRLVTTALCVAALARATHPGEGRSASTLAS
jgi:hypothetical protein